MPAEGRRGSSRAPGGASGEPRPANPWGGHLNPGTQVVTGLDLCHRKQSLQSSRLMGRSKQQTPLSRVPRIRRSLRSRKWTPTSQRPPHPLWNQLSWHAPAV